jgi:CheY-like chemotaxis protein
MKRILVVDDDALFRSMLGRLLRREGHAIAQAETGEEALRILEWDPCALVITDIAMPDMDGIELIRKLRGSHPGLPVIAMSGGSARLARDTQRCADALGAEAMLEKPFLPRQMTAAVAGLLTAGLGAAATALN